jgi:pSer/pThr/pTyr-binding forkhead associated (FHA) protein
MSRKVVITVTAGPMKGKTFAFEEHDTFLFGRLEECHCRLPDDGQVSRRHFIVEVNPPDARIRDFGSMNGTYVNEKKIGSRKEGAAQRPGAIERGDL